MLPIHYSILSYYVIIAKHLGAIVKVKYCLIHLFYFIQLWLYKNEKIEHPLGKFLIFECFKFAAFRNLFLNSNLIALAFGPAEKKICIGLTLVYTLCYCLVYTLNQSQSKKQTNQVVQSGIFETFRNEKLSSWLFKFFKFFNLAF